MRVGCEEGWPLAKATDLAKAWRWRLENAPRRADSQQHWDKEKLLENKAPEEHKLHTAATIHT